jgi:hypothetical protein
MPMSPQRMWTLASSRCQASTGSIILVAHTVVQFPKPHVTSHDSTSPTTAATTMLDKSRCSRRHDGFSTVSRLANQQCCV